MEVEQLPNALRALCGSAQLRVHCICRRAFEVAQIHDGQATRVVVLKDLFRVGAVNQDHVTRPLLALNAFRSGTVAGFVQGGVAIGFGQRGEICAQQNGGDGCCGHRQPVEASFGAIARP